MSINTSLKVEQTIKNVRDNIMSVTIGVPIAIVEFADELIQKKKAKGSDQSTSTNFQCSTTGREHRDLDDAMDEADGLVRACLATVKSKHRGAYVSSRVNTPSRAGAYFAVVSEITITHSY